MRSVEQGGFLAMQDCACNRPTPSINGYKYPYGQVLPCFLLCKREGVGREKERVEERITEKPVPRRGRTCIRLTRTLLERRSLRSASVLQEVFLCNKKCFWL